MGVYIDRCINPVLFLGSKELAIDLYSQGATELEKGVRVPIEPSGIKGNECILKIEL